MKFLVILISLMLSAFSCFAQETIDITIMDKKEGQKVVSYPADTKEFVISYGSYVTGIEGLEKLPLLETVELTGTAFLSDYSFLGSCKNLRYLMLWAIDIEDLSLKSCFLTFLQHLGKLPKELEFFNLAGNDLLTLKGLPKTNAKVFLTGNSLENEKSLKKQNYIFTESWSNLLPDSYMRFFR